MDWARDIILHLLVGVSLVQLLGLGYLLFRCRSLKKEIEVVELRMAENIVEFTDMISQDIDNLQRRSGLKQ